MPIGYTIKDTISATIGFPIGVSNILLSLISKYGVPALLFNNSEVYTDAAGTLPAGIGDVVGNLADLSGGSHDVSQTVTAAKPILRAGPLLEFDGTDDYLLNTTQPFTGGELTVVVCNKFRIAPAGTEYIFTIADSISNIDYFGFYGGGGQLRAIVNNAGSLDTVAGLAVGTADRLLSCRMNGTSSEVSVDQSRTTKTLAETLSLTTYERFGFGALVRPAVASFSNIDLNYAFVINKRLTDTELAQAEQYIAGICGVIL